MKLAALAFATVLGITGTAQQRVYDPGNGIANPVLVRDVKPTYTPAAMKAKIQGTVRLSAVVLDDGRVGEIRVVKSLDPELDQQAANALKQWEFKPGTREGEPVAVRVTCQLTFTLKQ